MTPPAIDKPRGNHLEEVAFAELFATWDQDFVNSAQGVEAVDEVLYRRQARAERYAVGWMARCLALGQARIVEVGCGTGVASIPLASRCRCLLGLDIDPRSIAVARARARHCQTAGNVEFIQVAPEHLLDRALSGLPDADVFVLYAVLEHMTPAERLDCLRRMWWKLPVGGAVVVVETPNRLTWEDKHTAYTDFFHMLPDEYALDYARRSPRPGLAEVFGGFDAANFRESRYRWGLGASFHEFELAFEEDLNEILVADGLEPEMVQMFPVEADELALRKYFLDRRIPQPIGFSRAVLNLVFRKPASRSEREANARYNEQSRQRLSRAE